MSFVELLFSDYVYFKTIGGDKVNNLADRFIYYCSLIYTYTKDNNLNQANKYAKKLNQFIDKIK